MSQEHWNELMMYTSLTLHRYSAVIEYAEQNIEKLKKRYKSASAMSEKYMSAYQFAKELASSGDDQAVDDVIDSWRQKNLSFFYWKITKEL